MNLYQISSEYKEILDDLYDDEGVVNQNALIKLEQNEIAMEKKAIAIASYIKNLEAERDAIKKAKQQMADREKRNKKREDELTGYLLSNMENRGLKEITCPYFNIRLKKCPPSVGILDENMIPDEYRRTKIEVSPDKIKMLQEMKMGVVIPGVCMQQNMMVDIR
jgi:Gp157 protein